MTPFSRRAGITSAHVLLVDDEPSVLHSTRLVLEEFGFRVTTLADANAILDTAREIAPDIILQDVRMPGLDLPSTLRALREHLATHAVPIVLFSASMDVQTLSTELGVTAYVEKPFDPLTLERAIRAALAGPHPLQLAN